MEDRTLEDLYGITKKDRPFEAVYKLGEIGMRCDKCQKEMESVIEGLKSKDWHKIMNYFEHELTEGEITDKTWESMTDALCSLKPEEEEK